MRLEETSTSQVPSPHLIVIGGDVIPVERDHERNIQGSRQRDGLAPIRAEMGVKQDGTFSSKFPLLTQAGAEEPETSALHLAHNSVPAEKVYS
jgi:hypothetical protein